MRFIIDENNNFSDKLLLYLRAFRVLNKLATILLCLIVFCKFNSIFNLLFLIGLIIKIVLLFFKIEIIINYDDEVLKKFESYCTILKDISKIKINGQNYSFLIKKHKPYYINFNLSIYEIKVRGYCIYYLPKGLLIFSKKTVDYISFENVEINYDKNLKCIIINKINDLKNIFLYMSNEAFNVFLKNFDSVNEEFNVFLKNFDSVNEEFDIIQKDFTSTNEEIKEIDITIKSIEDLKLNNNIPAEKDVTNETKNSVEYIYPTLDLIKNKKSTIKKYIRKINNNSSIMIPIGEYNGKLILENIEDILYYSIYGKTMPGKSSYVNSILSFLLFYDPKMVKLLIYDSKSIEFFEYNFCPHLLCPVIVNSEKFTKTIQKVCVEIDKRVELLSLNKIRNINIYNETAKEKIPTIIVVVDEYNENINNEIVNNSIEYIVTHGRAVNIFMIVTTNYINYLKKGVLSSNKFPTLLKMNVKNIDNNLNFDYVYNSKSFHNVNVTIPSIENEDFKNIIKFEKDNNKPNKFDCFEKQHTSTKNSSYDNDSEDDPMYKEVVEFAIETGKISASLIQRRFRFGYNRAARIVNLLEARGVVGPQNGSKPREVLIKYDNM